jgi:hypothetical protein
LATPPVSLRTSVPTPRFVSLLSCLVFAYYAVYLLNARLRRNTERDGIVDRTPPRHELELELNP